MSLARFSALFSLFLFCKADVDIDSVLNQCDNPTIYSADFRLFRTVNLSPQSDEKDDKQRWEIYNGGSQLVLLENSGPSVRVAPYFLVSLDLEGSIFVDSEAEDGGYIGFVFAFQNSNRFYSVTWKKNNQTYRVADPFKAVADQGLQIKLVNSQSGASPMLRNALWHTGDTENEVKLLWKDPQSVGWRGKVSYRWLLLHRPQIGLIRLRVFENEEILADSGNIFDEELKGGNAGVFSFDQEKVVWSDLFYRCNDKVPEVVYRELPPNLQRQVNVDVSAAAGKEAEAEEA